MACSKSVTFNLLVSSCENDEICRIADYKVCKV